MEAYRDTKDRRLVNSWFTNRNIPLINGTKKGVDLEGSKFDIDSELIKGEFGLESIVDKYGVGTYRAAFLVDGKIRYLSSFEVREK